MIWVDSIKKKLRVDLSSQIESKISLDLIIVEFLEDESP